MSYRSQEFSYKELCEYSLRTCNHTGSRSKTFSNIKLYHSRIKLITPNPPQLPI